MDLNFPDFPEIPESDLQNFFSTFLSEDAAKLIPLQYWMHFDLTSPSKKIVFGAVFSPSVNVKCHDQLLSSFVIEFANKPNLMHPMARLS